MHVVDGGHVVPGQAGSARSPQDRCNILRSLSKEVAVASAGVVPLLIVPGEPLKTELSSLDGVALVVQKARGNAVTSVSPTVVDFGLSEVGHRR